MISAVERSNKFYAILGKLLIQKEPETASKLISLHISESKPQETDLNKIPDLFIKFCTAQNLEPEDYKGALFKSSKIDQRRLFIGTMVKMYGNPWGLGVSISRSLNQHKQATSKMIGEVMSCYEHCYKDSESFSEAVDAIVEKMKGGEYACA